MSEERFDPSRHSLADAAKRLKEISEKDYTSRLAEVLGRHEEESTSEQDTDKQPVVLEPGVPITMVPGQWYTANMAVDNTTLLSTMPMGTPVLGATNIMGGAYANPWVNPSYSQPVTYNLAPAPDPWTDERLREIVAKAIKEVLYPDSDGIVTHQHRRVRQWDETGQEWRGVLYKVEKEEEL